MTPECYQKGLGGLENPDEIAELFKPSSPTRAARPDAQACQAFKSTPEKDTPVKPYQALQNPDIGPPPP